MMFTKCALAGVLTTGAVGCTGGSSTLDSSGTDGTDGTDRTDGTDGNTSPTPTDPPDLGIFEPADPDGDLQLIEAHKFSYLGYFGAYGVVLNVSDSPRCFVDVVLDLTSPSGFSVGTLDTYTRSEVRRLDAFNTNSCIEPGGTGWFAANDYDGQAVGEVRSVLVTLTSHGRLRTFDPHTTVVVRESSVEISTHESSFGSAYADIAAEFENIGAATAYFEQDITGYRAGTVRMLNENGRFFDMAHCKAAAGSVRPGSSTTVLCTSLAEEPADVLFTPSWD